MKKQITLKYFGRHGGGYYAKKKNDPLLCHEELAKLFVLPRIKKTPITVVLSDKKMPESYQVSFGLFSIAIHYERKWHSVTVFYDARQYLRSQNLENKKFWIAIEY